MERKLQNHKYGIMAKYLIFRTDRIGDFITSQVISSSIYESSNKNQIDMVTSKYNYNYIKHFKYIRNLYIFDKTGFKILDFFNLYLKIRKKNYDYLIILDGKRRSFLSGIFVKAKTKICFLKDFFPKILIFMFYSKYIKNAESNIQFKNFETLLNYIDIKLPKKLNFYNKYKFKINLYNFKKPYLHLHLDEKWFENHYFHDFDYMQLNEDKIYTFINLLVKKFKMNIVVTQGFKKVNIMDKFKSKYFNANKKFIKLNNKKIFFIENSSFRDLENIVNKSKLLICCEGAISHVSHSLNVKTILLVQKDRLNSTNFWIGHMNNTFEVFRDNINTVSKNILKFNFV